MRQEEVSKGWDREWWRTLALEAADSVMMFALDLVDICRNVALMLFAIVFLFSMVAAIIFAAYSLSHASDFETCVARGNQRCTARFPTPTPSPQPTAHPTQCDADFRYDPSSKIFTYRLTPEPGREYHLCADLPPRTAIAVELKTQNRSNTSCDVYAVTAHAPSNYSAILPPAVQPGFPFKFEPGRWQFDVTLDPDPETLCSGNHGLVLYAWSW